jgi:AcrR family transcriptional regulator
MTAQPDTRRQAIQAAARRTLAADPAAPLAAVAAEAGVSRATLYRYFPSRASLLDAVDVALDPGTGERIRAAAAALIARDGLARLSMDEVAEAAGVSRASVYRIYPGKPALFAAILAAESPFDEVTATLHRLHDRPPVEVLPTLIRILDRVASPRIGILRTLMFEVTTGTPEAVEAAGLALQPMIGEVSAYFAGQMQAGTVRRMHPMLAAQAFVGPFVFHLLSRSIAAPLGGLTVESADAADAFARVALRGLAPDPPEE